MPASVSDSYRNNEIATPTFMTPFGVPFFSWSEDGEYVKRSMEELRPMYEAWEKHVEALRARATKVIDELGVGGQAAPVAAEYEAPTGVPTAKQSWADEVESELFADEHIAIVPVLTVEESRNAIGTAVELPTPSIIVTSDSSEGFTDLAAEPGTVAISVVVTDVDTGSSFIWDALDVGEPGASVPPALAIDAGRYLSVPDWIPVPAEADASDDEIVVAVTPVPAVHAKFTVFRDESVRPADPVAVDPVSVAVGDATSSIIGADLLDCMRALLARPRRGVWKACDAGEELGKEKMGAGKKIPKDAKRIRRGKKGDDGTKQVGTSKGKVTRDRTGSQASRRVFSTMENVVT